MELRKRISNKITKKDFEVEMKFPTKNLLIEVTNHCNNKCIFCYNHCMKRIKKNIDEKLCKKVLNEAYELGCREIGFYVTGEPLLNTKLGEYISYAKEIGYKYIYITTNGILANLNKVKYLYENGLNSIKYSINAENDEDYKFIHGTNNFEKVIKNLKDVYKWKLKNNIPLKVYVSYIATKYTNNTKKIKDLFDKVCDEFVIMQAINQGGLMPNIKETLSNNVNTEIDNTIKLPCNYPFNSVIVTVEGYLTACCMDFENFLAYADLNKQSLKDSWNNNIIKQLRKMHLENNVDGTICENCIKNNLNIPNPLNKELCKLEKYDIFCNHLNDVVKEKN